MVCILNLVFRHLKRKTCLALVSLGKNDFIGNALDASMSVTGTCLQPVDVGFALRDENGTIVDTYYSSDRYKSGSTVLEHTFGNLRNGQNYELYPVVSLRGSDMLVTPQAGHNLELQVSSVAASSVTNSSAVLAGLIVDYHGSMAIDSYGFSLNGKDYASNNMDSHGRFTHKIESLQPSTDYEFMAYVIVNGVRYVGKSVQFRTEEDKFHYCPDDNHPHAIDLCLPSGTKWACCNVGASAPEGYGNYYAWGETSTKSVYSWDKYQHLSSWGDAVNIGSDIAGTQYDAATANWGGPWHMPTLAQTQELLDNTTSVWITENGLYGRKFTGSNGYAVFLPAAGYCSCRHEPDELGQLGNYWSSSLDENNPLCAYIMNFYFGDVYCGVSYGRVDGLSVRPVR